MSARNRAKTPVILQMEAAECGAAALAIVLGYYGLHLPLERVREDCGVSRDGSRAINILKAARRYGMEAKGLRLDLDDLGMAEKPLILHWNFDHFVVLEGISGNQVFINDPAMGSRVLGKEELSQAFTGVALEIRPGDDFRQGGTPVTLKETLFPLLSTERRAIIFLIIAGFAMLVPGIAIPAIIRIFIDDILIENNIPLFVPVIGFLGLIIAVQGSVSWIREFCIERWQVDLSFRRSMGFFSKILSLPIQFFDHRYAGEIASRVTLNDHVSLLISGKAAGSVLDLIVSVILLCLLFMYNGTLTVIVVIVTAANLVYIWWQSRHQRELNRKLMMDEGRLIGTAISGLSGIESLKAGGNESAFFEKWAGYHARYINAELANTKFSTFSGIVPTFINGIGTASILAIGALMVLNDTITTGSFFGYLAPCLHSTCFRFRGWLYLEGNSRSSKVHSRDLPMSSTMYLRQQTVNRIRTCRTRARIRSGNSGASWNFPVLPLGTLPLSPRLLKISLSPSGLADG